MLQKVFSGARGLHHRSDAAPERSSRYSSKLDISLPPLKPLGWAMVSDSDLQALQGYVLYGASLEDLVLRTIGFAEGCSKIVADEALEPVFRKLCRDTMPKLARFSSVDDVYRAISDNPRGLYIVLKVMTSIENIASIALIPVNEFNKKVASSRHS